MKTQMSINSVEAYHHHVASGEKCIQRMRILELLGKFNQLTRREISRITGIELGAVGGRINKLIEDELVVECGNIICPHTNRSVSLVKLK